MPSSLALLFLSLACGEGPSAQPDAPQTAPARQQAKKGPDLGYTAAGIVRRRRPKLQIMPVSDVHAIAADVGPDELSLLFVGDVLLGHKLDAYQADHGDHYAFAHTAPLLQQADLTVGNLEGVLIDTDKYPTKWSQRADTRTAQALAWAGFDLVTLGNNHFANYDDAGVLSTVAALDAAGIGSVGVGADPAAARAPWVGEVEGLRVAVINGVADSMLLDPAWLSDDRKIAQRHAALVRDLTHAGGKRQQATWLYTPETLAEDVSAAREVADIVVVDLHWGVILHRPPYTDQVALAKAAADAGADLVLGEHAHIWQPAALVGGVPVVYGLGNFAMGFPSKAAEEGLVARAIVSRDSHRITRVELFPINTNNTRKTVAYQTPLLAGASARVVLDDLATWSDTLFGTPLDVRSDRAVLEVPVPSPDEAAATTGLAPSGSAEGAGASRAKP